MKSIVVTLTSFFLISLVLLMLTLRGSWGNPTPEEIIQVEQQIGNAFESSMARGRFAQTMALVQDGRSDLTNGKEIIAAPDVGEINGKYYPLFAPGLAYYSVPAYFLGSLINASQIAVFTFNALVSIGAGALIIIIVHHLGAPKWAAWFAGFSYLFATTAFPYAVTLAQHNFTSLFLLLILISGLVGPKKGYFYILGWLAYALAFFMDYPNLLLLFPAMIFMVIQSIQVAETRRSTKVKLQLAILYSSVFFLIFSGFHGLYNLNNFGSPITIGPAVVSRVKSFDLTNNNSFTDNNTQNSTSSPIELTNSLFEIKRIPNGLNVLLTSQGRGIVYFAPLTLFGIIGIIYLLSSSIHRNFALSLIFTIAVNIFLYSAFGDPWGGWSYGPRYLIPTMAILSIGTGYSLYRVRNYFYRLLLFILFCYGAFINLTGSLTTNLLPPDVEAISLGLDYTYFYNVNMIKQGQNSSSAFISVFSKYLSSSLYFSLIYSIVICIAFAVIFFPIIQNMRRERR